VSFIDGTVFISVSSFLVTKINGWGE
jgi:hypothetical protein